MILPTVERGQVSMYTDKERRILHIEFACLFAIVILLALIFFSFTIGALSATSGTGAVPQSDRNAMVMTVGTVHTFNSSEETATVHRTARDLNLTEKDVENIDDSTVCTVLYALALALSVAVIAAAAVDRRKRDRFR